MELDSIKIINIKPSSCVADKNKDIFYFTYSVCRRLRSGTFTQLVVNMDIQGCSVINS